MSDDAFLRLYPCYVIGKYSDEESRDDPAHMQSFALTLANQQWALMVFTETLFAERVIIAEAAVGHIIEIRSPSELASVLRQFQEYFTLVLIDPNPITKSGRGFPVEEFLRGLPR